MITRDTFDLWVIDSVAEGVMTRLEATMAKALLDDMISPNGDIYSRGDKIKTLRIIPEVFELKGVADEAELAEPEAELADKADEAELAEPEAELIEDTSEIAEIMVEDGTDTDSSESTDEVDLESMSKIEIEAYARSKGVELDRRKSKAVMIAEFKG